MTSSRRIAARIRAMPPAEPEPGWEERARQRYQESIMSIEITDCANRGKVYHNVKLLDGRRADVAVGSAIDGLGIEVYVGGTSIAAGVDEASSVLGDSCPLIISSMEATADVIGRRDPRLSDIRDEIVALTRHRDARDRGGQHVGTGGRLSSAPPSVERVLREWLAKIDGAMPVAPPQDGPSAEDIAQHARVMQRGADAVRWRETVEPLLLQLCDEFTAAVRHHETRGAGGQQVSYLGPFASVGPSVVGEMRRWVVRLSDATAPTKEQG